MSATTPLLGAVLRLVLQRPAEASTWTTAELDNELCGCDPPVPAVRCGNSQNEDHPVGP